MVLSGIGHRVATLTRGTRTTSGVCSIKGAD
ncbi:hypothetical protein SCANM124S_07872 [Streptomyces canus]